MPRSVIGGAGSILRVPSKRSPRSSVVISAGGAAPVTPISLVVSDLLANQSNGSTSSAMDTTGATLLVVGIAYFSGATGVSISDSEANTWTALTEYASGGGNGRVRIYYAENPITDASHTFTLSGTELYGSMVTAAFDNVATTTPFDTENGAGSVSATTQQPGSVTPASNNSLLVTVLQYIDGTSPASASIDSGFTVIESSFDTSSQNFSIALAYKVQTTAGAENPTWSSNEAADRMAAAIAVFEHA